MHGKNSDQFLHAVPSIITSEFPQNFVPSRAHISQTNGFWYGLTTLRQSNMSLSEFDITELQCMMGSTALLLYQQRRELL